MTNTEIKANEAKMIAHLLQRIATMPTKLDQLQAQRSAAIARRDWASMDAITRQIGGTK
jgi:hypothetical protein